MAKKSDWEAGLFLLGNVWLFIFVEWNYFSIFVLLI